MPDLAAAIYLHPVDQPVKLVVRRGGVLQPLQLAGQLVDRPGDRLQALASPEQHLVARLGVLALAVESAPPEVAATLRRRTGVIVAARLAEPGTAENGLQAGDVIYFVNQRSVSDLPGLRAAVDAIRPGAPVVLTVERQGKLSYLSFEME
jgi:S1-C subfamily serine protease